MNAWIKYLSTPQEKTMQMFVRFNNTIVVNMGKNDVAYQLKHLVAFKYGLAICIIWLIRSLTEPIGNSHVYSLTRWE